MVRWLIFVAVWVIAGCDNVLERYHQNPLQPAAPQPAEQARVSLSLLQPAITPSSSWKINVTALYHPVDMSEPGTTVTSSSYSNCRKPATVVWAPSFNLSPCTSTTIRSLEKQLKPEQVRIEKKNSLSIDFAQAVEEGGAHYLINKLFVSVVTCSQGCAEQSQEISLSCWDEELTSEIFSDLFRLYYFSPTSPLNATKCGLHKGDWVGWTTREAIMQRVRGHFGEAEGMISGELLDSFSVIPWPKGGWKRNATYLFDHSYSGCKKSRNDQTYDRADTVAKLDEKFGWKYASDVEILVFRRMNGEVCAIWLDSNVPNGEFVSRLRYFYEFEKGELVGVSTEEPNKVKRAWRYVKGQPYEYINRYDPDSVAGEETILYWQRDAATAWPERMDYSPDFEEFAQQAAYAKALVDVFGKIQNPPQPPGS